MYSGQFMISFSALNHTVARKAFQDPVYRAELKRKGKVLLSEAKPLPDADLLAKLHTHGPSMAFFYWAAASK